MANKIGWCDMTWSPITGCTPISDGCTNCWASRMAKRLAGRNGYDKDEPFKPTVHLDRLDNPKFPKKPSKIFVCSMGDLFHEEIPDDALLCIFGKLMEYPQHIFQILTKRPKRMLAFEKYLDWPDNFWMGVTAENQEMADKRIPTLLQMPAAVRFVSCEPLLGPIDIARWLRSGADGLPREIDWIPAGPETGPGARPMNPDWAKSLRDQCLEAGIPFFYKKGLLDGVEYHQFPNKRRHP